MKHENLNRNWPGEKNYQGKIECAVVVSAKTPIGIIHEKLNECIQENKLTRFGDITWLPMGNQICCYTTGDTI